MLGECGVTAPTQGAGSLVYWFQMAAQEHRLPAQSLLGMDKAGMIQVRQPNVHCKYTHYSQDISAAFFTGVSRYKCTARCVSDSHYILQSLMSPLLLFDLCQHPLQYNQCENKLIETEIAIREMWFLLSNRESH